MPQRVIFGKPKREGIMTMQSRGTRWMAMALAASLALATVAPAAEAGRRYKSNKRGHDRVKVTRVVRHAPPARRVVVHRHDDGGSFASFFGGLVLGAAISQIAQQAAYADEAPAYYYWDPYCHERFASLEVYYGHFHRHRHPRMVRVVTVHEDRWVDSLNWRDGRWDHCNNDWDSGYDRYDRVYDRDWGYYRH